MSTPFNRLTVSLACLSIAAGLGGGASAQDNILTLERTPSGHLVIPITINETGPYTFLFDTGASHTAIAQPVAESLGFRSEWIDTGDVQSLTTRFEAERFQLGRVRFSGGHPIQLNSVVIPVAEGDPQPVDGLLGADAITARRYEIDFSTGEVDLGAAAARFPDGQVNGIGLLLGQAHLQRGVSHINVILDSGSARSIANRQLARYIRQRSGTVRYNINGVDDDIDVEAIPTYVRRFQIGGLCLDGFWALQSDLDVFGSLGWDYQPSLVLGMDVLQFATVTVDRESGRVQIDAASDENACAR